MKRFLIILSFIIISFNTFSQPGFNKTFYFLQDQSTILTDIIKIDSVFFIIGGSSFFNPEGTYNQAFGFFNLNEAGDTSNLHLLLDTSRFVWGEVFGNAKLINNDKIFCSYRDHLTENPAFNETKLIYLTLYDTIFTKTVYSDTLKNYPNDIIYLDGYYYITGNIQLPGYTYNNIMLLKTDTLGNLIWMKHFGSNKAFGNRIIGTYDHRIMVAARRDYSNGNNEDQSQWYIMKLDTAGNIIWTQDYGNPSLNDYTPAYMIETSDSNYIITGYYGITRENSNPYYSDAFTKGRLLKIDPDGNILMDKLYGYSPTGSISGVTLIKEKNNKELITVMNTVVAPDSIFYSTSNCALVLLTKTGEIKWFRQYYYNYLPPTYYLSYDMGITFESFEFTSDGGYIFVGTGMDNNQTSMRGWILKTDSLGFDGVSTYNLDTAYRVEHIADTCFNDTAVVYTHIYGVTAPYSITYSGFATHDSLYYSPLFERFVADSLIITTPMLSDSDSLINIICHITDGIGRMLTDTITINVSCLFSGTPLTKWQNEIMIFPNPATDNLTVEIRNDKLKITNIKIVDLTGKQIMSSFRAGGVGISTPKHPTTIDTRLHGYVYRVDIGNLPTGLYFVKVETNQGTVVKKFVKQ